MNGVRIFTSKIRYQVQEKRCPKCKAMTPTMVSAYVFAVDSDKGFAEVTCKECGSEWRAKVTREETDVREVKA